MSAESVNEILQASGNAFFDKLNDYLQTKIPVLIKNVLLAMDVDRAILLSTFDDKSIQHIEQFMRKEFSTDMVCDGQSLADYLGKFENSQSKFALSYGQKLMVTVISDSCRELVHKSKNVVPVTSASVNSSDSVVATRPTTSDSQEASTEYENIHLTDTFDEKAFKQYIGSLMIPIYNDAKRLTLSSWSWPARHVAAEKAHNYKVTGDPICNPKLHYVTPFQHTEFLNCIVESDLHNLKNRISNSLALSLRVDGSVDRTQDHNIYVMGHIVNDDATVSTIFIGFDVPEEGRAPGYFDCVKSVVNEILPWETVLHLMSSIVTDGEELNLGCHTGLHMQLLNEIRRLIASTKPFLSIWCLGHRVNLAWEDVCKECPIIGIIVAEASSLSSFFHKSGVRTASLERVAASNGLNPPLRYVTFFPVRWTQYVYDLLRVTLRNWRAAMAYFVASQQTPLQHRWLLYDRIHFLSFLTDVLRRFKTFQKTFESDNISILEVQEKKQKLFQELEQMLHTPSDQGWEQLFLDNVYEDGDGEIVFYGHELIRNCERASRQPTFAFNTDTRKTIIESLHRHLTERLDYDAVLQNNLQPLKSITSETTHQQLKSCYRTIVPDLDEHEFISDYWEAVNILQHYEFRSTLATLQKIHSLRPNGMKVLKTALARVVAAKPHSQMLSG